MATELPLASILMRHTPNHPLIHLIARPVLLRLGWIEGTLLTNASLLRRLSLSSACIDALAIFTIGAVSLRFRAHYRVMLGLLGSLEGIVRTVRLLQSLEADEDEDQQEQQKEREQKSEETKHVLCFWLFYSLLAVGQSIRSTSATNSSLAKPLSHHLTLFNRRLKALARPLTTRYPSLAFFNAPPRLTPHQPRTFPQPRPFIPVIVPRPSVPGEWLNYQLLKVLLLWIALRRDGFGASALWDWILGPILRVRDSRRAQKGLGKTRRRLRLVLEEEQVDHDGPQSPRQDVFASSEASSSTTTSPSHPRKQYDPNASFSSGASESPYQHSTSSSSSSTAFPTPNIPYRLTSSSHPIISRGPQNDHSAHLTSRIESPTPIRSVPYHVENLLGSAEKDRLGDSWAASGNWGPHE